MIVKHAPREVLFIAGLKAVKLVSFCQHTHTSQDGVVLSKPIHSHWLSLFIQATGFELPVSCQCEIAAETYMLYFQTENVFCHYETQYQSCLTHNLINRKWRLSSSFVGNDLDPLFMSVFEKITF